MADALSQWSPKASELPINNIIQYDRLCYNIIVYNIASNNIAKWTARCISAAVVARMKRRLPPRRAKRACSRPHFVRAPALRRRPATATHIPKTTADVPRNGGFSCCRYCRGFLRAVLATSSMTCLPLCTVAKQLTPQHVKAQLMPI